MKPYEENIAGPDGYDTNSPSKTTQKLGQNVVEGYTMGMEDQKNDANRRSKALFDSFFDTIVATADAMQQFQTIILNALSNLETHFPMRLETYKRLFETGWSNINSVTSTSWANIQSTVTTAMSNLTNYLPGQFRSIGNSIENMNWRNVGSNIVNGIQNGISDGRHWLEYTAYNIADNLRYSFDGVSWWSVGDNIVAGIQEGVRDNWRWLDNTVRNLANSLYDAACEELGINSPSKVFAEIGGFVDAGLQQGLKDGESDVLHTAANIADAITKEMTPDSPKVDVTTEGLVGGMQAVISGLDGVADTFKVILDTLRSMGGLLTPQIATGTVVPYKTKIDSSAGDNADLVDTLETLNGDLESVIIQVVNNAVVSIVDAIQSRGGGANPDDLNSMTKRVIDEINRRARAQGSSPILV